MHEAGCKCCECAYPQRSRPPVMQVKQAEAKPDSYVRELRLKQLDKIAPYQGN
jgi:hypothetical protein